MSDLVLGIVASIIAALLIAAVVRYWSYLKPRLLPRLMGPRLARTIRIWPRWDLPGIYSKMLGARKRVLILQTWFPNWDQEYSTWVELMKNIKALQKVGQVARFEFKVLLMDPSLHDSRLRARGDLRDLIVGRTSMYLEPEIPKLREFVRSHSDEQTEVGIALYNSIPFGPIYCVDDYIYWGLFVSYKESMNSLCFRARADSEIGKAILDSFLNSWIVRSSEIRALRGPVEKSDYEKRVSKEFNELREKLSRFSLLGMITVRDQRVIASRELLACLSTCLNSNVQTLVVMRHAATPLNERRIFSGLLSVRLSDAGRRQVLQLAENVPDLSTLNWGQVFCSTVVRTRETLQILVPRCHIVPARELDERNIGILEGRDKDVVKYSTGNLRNCWKFFWEPELGESYAELFQRLNETRFLEQLIVAGARSAQNTLICTHEGPMKIIRMILEAGCDLKPGELDVIEKVEVENCDVCVYVDVSNMGVVEWPGHGQEFHFSQQVEACAREAEKVSVSMLLKETGG